MILSRWPYIFVGCLAFVLIVAGLITWRCCVRRRKRKAAQSAAIILPGADGRAPSQSQQNLVSFKNLEQGDMEMRQSVKGGYGDMGGYRGSEYRGSSEYQRASAAGYRPSFASSRTRV